ncbi:MAG: GNAT family N-acetyltransferase [Vicinamibacterales bacterium]
MIRPATLEDAAEIVRLVNSAYRGESSRAGWTTEADLLGGQRVDEQAIAATLVSPKSVILLQVRHGSIVGCVHLESTGDAGYLGMLTVAPTEQGRGLGRRLLEAAEAWATTHWAAAAMQMTVIAQRIELLAWYERRGYRKTGERRPFPYGDDRFGVPRRDDLVFDVLRKELLSPRTASQPAAC